MSGMNKIIEIHEADSDIVVQSGVKWEDLNAALAEKNIPLFFPLDPGPGATIGGMIATGCSGTNAVRYGTAKAEWFLNVTVVLPNGQVIKTRRRARKSSAGFDTTKLFIGAEGTLGIVTEGQYYRDTSQPKLTLLQLLFDLLRNSQRPSQLLSLKTYLQPSQLLLKCYTHRWVVTSVRSPVSRKTSFVDSVLRMRRAYGQPYDGSNQSLGHVQ